MATRSQEGDRPAVTVHEQLPCSAHGIFQRMSTHWYSCAPGGFRGLLGIPFCPMALLRKGASACIGGQEEFKATVDVTKIC